MKGMKKGGKSTNPMKVKDQSRAKKFTGKKK